MPPEDIGTLKKILNISVSFEGPSDWTTREYIKIIDEYLMERLAVMINNVLTPYGFEASIREDINECTLAGETPGCRDTVIVELYSPGSSHPTYYAIYHRRLGDNTYEFYLKNILKTKTKSYF